MNIQKLLPSHGYRYKQLPNHFICIEFGLMFSQQEVQRKTPTLVLCILSLKVSFQIQMNIKSFIHGTIKNL